MDILFLVHFSKVNQNVFRLLNARLQGFVCPTVDRCAWFCLSNCKLDKSKKWINKGCSRYTFYFIYRERSL